MSGEIREIYKEGPGVEEETEEFEEIRDTDEFDEAEGSEENDALEFSDTATAQYVEKSQEEQAFERRMQKRRARVRGRKRRRKILGVLLIIALFAALATMCGKDIVKLKAENIALKKQQKELEEEKDRLREEVENSGNREYVQEQARKQLRLLNPGELIFTFEDEEE